jgi:hypothetical protein
MSGFALELQLMRKPRGVTLVTTVPLAGVGGKAGGGTRGSDHIPTGPVNTYSGQIQS